MRVDGDDLRGGCACKGRKGLSLVSGLESSKIANTPPWSFFSTSYLLLWVVIRFVPVHAKASEKYRLEFGSNLGMNGNCKRLSDVELLVSRTFQWRYPVFQTPILGNSRVIAAEIRPCLSCFGYMFSSGDNRI